MSENYNCPNCGAPIGYTDKCDYCGTRIEWRPYVIHLAPRLYYHKVYDASVIGMVKKGALGTENPFSGGICMAGRRCITRTFLRTHQKKPRRSEKTEL